MSTNKAKQMGAKADDMIRELAAQAAEPIEGEAEVVAEAVEEAEPPTLAVVENDPAPEAEPTVDAGEQEPEPDPTPDLAAKLEAAEQRYRTLQGMHNADKAVLEQYKELVEMQTQAAQQPAEPAPVAAPQGWNAEDVSQFGDDLIDLMSRVSRQVVSDQVAELKTMIEGLQGEVKGVASFTAQTAQEKFEADLTTAVPNWRTIDSNEEFSTWLSSVPAVNKVFAQAVNDLDAGSVVGVFQMFENITGAGKQTVDAQAQARQQQLEAQVSPKTKTVQPAAAKQEEGPKQWTLSEIKSVYANKKNYSHEEFLALEKEIADAQKTQRVEYNA